jgi:hypothetical protein
MHTKAHARMMKAAKAGDVVLKRAASSPMEARINKLMHAKKRRY